jgi:hypothetical protein
MPLRKYGRILELQRAMCPCPTSFQTGDVSIGVRPELLEKHYRVALFTRAFAAAV